MRRPNILLLIHFVTGLVSRCNSFALPSHLQRRSHPRKLAAREESGSNSVNIDSDKEDRPVMGTWNPFSLLVLRLRFTEPAWTSSLNYQKGRGIYECASCHNPLFSSAAKFDSGSGWPSFWKTVSDNRVALKKEWDGRIECSCANCGGHLGELTNSAFAKWCALHSSKIMLLHSYDRSRVS